MNQIPVLKIAEHYSGLSSVFELEEAAVIGLDLSSAEEVGKWLLASITAIHMEFEYRLDNPMITIERCLMPSTEVDKIQVEALLFDLDIPAN